MPEAGTGVSKHVSGLEKPLSLGRHQAGVDVADSLALVAFFYATDWQQWIIDTNWLTRPVPLWHGVTVEDGRVTRLEIPDNNLNFAAGVSTFPPELGDLAFLEVLDLQGNVLRGDLTDVISRLSRLEELRVNNNLFTRIPVLSATNPALRVVDVADNLLTFDSLLPNVGQGFRFTYAPQRTFGLLRDRATYHYEGQPVELASGIAGEGYHFQWYLGPVTLPGATGPTYTILELTESNNGPYVLEVTHDGAPDLTLRSSGISVGVLERAELQWLDIGAYHHAYTASGGYRDGSVGMEYPAILRYAGHLRFGAFWVGVRDWTDTSGQEHPYFVARLGTRAGDAIPESAHTTSITNALIGRYEDTVVEVNGVPSFDKDAPLDEIDPDLAADRMVHSVNHLSMGIQVDRKAYAFTNEYHDNYHLIDYAFCNTGNVDADDEIELPDQTLQEVFFFYSSAWRGPEQVGNVQPRDNAWGRYTTYDVVGDGHELYPVDFTAQYAWVGWDLASYATNYDNFGKPMIEAGAFPHVSVPYDRIGRLAAATMPGRATLHADRSTTDPTYDRGQPSVMSYLDNDGNLNRDTETQAAYYRLGIVGPTLGNSEYDCIPCRRVYPHFADRNQPDGQFWKFTRSFELTGRIAGGYAATSAYGPYNMEPGECVNITVSEGVAGLSFDAAARIGRTYIAGGRALDDVPIAYDANRDGAIDSTSFDYSQVFVGTEYQTKNQWVLSARDSLFQTFYRARDAFEASDGLTIYPIAEPPRAPTRFSLTSRPPDAIDLAWTPAPEGPALERWEVYRTTGWADNLYGNGCLDDEAIPCGYEPIATLAADATAYSDTGLDPDETYYYYLQAVGEPQPVDAAAILGSPGGAPLRSGRYMTQTYTPISPSDGGPGPVEQPEQSVLLGQFPNPFSQTTTFRYLIPRSTDVRLVVYDVLGREVELLVDAFKDAGLHEVVFQPTRSHASGVYFYALRAGEREEMGRMVLVR